MKKRGLALLMAMALLTVGSLQAVAGETVAAMAAEEPAVEVTLKDEAAIGSTRFVFAPSGISKDSKGSMYMADRSYHVLRMRTNSGSYTVLAGTEGVSGYKDGSAKDALFNSPWDVVPYKNGWAISDTENHVIRYYNGKTVKTIAGSNTAGYANATGRKAQFYRPTGLAAGEDGEIYVADTGNHVIRKIDKNGKVTLYAGSKEGCADGKVKEAQFNEPTGLYYYKGALYVADSGNHRICKIAGGKVTTIAGSSGGVEGDANGSASKARFSNPQDIILYKNDIYISDTGNGSVKKLSNGKVTTLVKAFSRNNQNAPAEPCGLMIKNGYLFVGDLFVEELLKIKM